MNFKLPIFSPSRILFLFCLFFIVGIFFASFFNFPIFFFYFLCQLSLFFFLFSFDFKFFLSSLFLLSVLFGYFWYQRAILKFETSPISLVAKFKKEVELEGAVISFLKKDTKTQRILFLVEKLDGTSEKGKIEIILPANFPIEIGDKLLVRGKLSFPSQEFLGFYQKEKIFALCSFPKITFLKKNYFPNFFYFFNFKIGRLKERIYQIIFENFQKEEAFILAGVLLGEKEKISFEFKEKLKNAGLSHIVVVSGLHFIILTTVLLKTFLFLGFSLKKSFLFSFIFIFLFLSLNGFQSAAVRATIMISFFILAALFNRQYFSHRSLFFAATLMLLENPFLLKNDLSFQLSFLATLGISLLFANFQTIFREIPNVLGIRNIFSATLSAQYFTFPFILFTFGYISLSFALSNILVLFILPYLIFLGIVFLFLSLFFPLLSQVLIFPLRAILVYILKVVEFFSKPWATVKLNFSIFHLLFTYSILIFGAWQIKKRESLNF